MPIRFHLFQACPSVPNFIFTLLFISSFNAFVLILVTDPTVGIFGKFHETMVLTGTLILYLNQRRKRMVTHSPRPPDLMSVWYKITFW